MSFKILSFSSPARYRPEHKAVEQVSEGDDSISYIMVGPKPEHIFICAFLHTTSTILASCYILWHRPIASCCICSIFLYHRHFWTCRLDKVSWLKSTNQTIPISFHFYRWTLVPQRSLQGSWVPLLRDNLWWLLGWHTFLLVNVWHETRQHDSWGGQLSARAAM